MFDIVTGEDQKILHTVCAPVTVFDERLESLVQEMIDTMTAPDPDTEVVGIGLAANQVNVNARVMLITLNVGTKKEHKVLPMINPEIIEMSPKKVWMEEGCLSLPGMFGRVERPSKVKVCWQNVEGNMCEKKFEAWDARIFLHEYDHLEGKLFIEYPLKDFHTERPKNS